MVRIMEIEQSLWMIRSLADSVAWPSDSRSVPLPHIRPVPEKEPQCLVFAAVEGWRGEIVHAAVTDERGRWKVYKIVDPSFHNWKALELSMRNTEIADFPVNNKSYDLSYCGFDL
jgi:Ni,Fe-hydrogenase III large subunit